jgi:hypothetical protein
MSGVQYTCREGYIIVGRSYLICDVDERWNGPPPRCEPILCPNAPTIPNGVVTISANLTVFGTKASYTCLSGYELIGDKTLTCNKAGYWDGQVPFCKSKLDHFRTLFVILFRY